MIDEGSFPVVFGTFVVVMRFANWYERLVRVVGVVDFRVLRFCRFFGPACFTAGDRGTALSCDRDTAT